MIQVHLWECGCTDSLWGGCSWLANSFWLICENYHSHHSQTGSSWSCPLRAIAHSQNERSTTPFEINQDSIRWYGKYGSHRPGTSPFPCQVDLSSIVSRTDLYSGAELVAVCQTAALAAMRDETVQNHKVRGRITGVLIFSLPTSREWI